MDFLDTVQKPQAMKERINKPDCIKIENFSSSCNLKKVQIQANHWEKIFLKAQLIKDCYPRYTKIFLKFSYWKVNKYFYFPYFRTNIFKSAKDEQISHEQMHIHGK